MSVPHFGLRRVVLEKIASDALIESGGDGDELVSVPYVFLLELIDGYKASGWARDMPNVEPKDAPHET